MNNLVNKANYTKLHAVLEQRLTKRLKNNGDEFSPDTYNLNKWGIKIDAEGTLPYSHQ